MPEVFKYSTYFYAPYSCGPFEECFPPFYISVAENITETCFYMCKLHYVMYFVLPQPVGEQVYHYRLFLELVRASVQKFPKIWRSPSNF